jgi:hypothetical protein
MRKSGQPWGVGTLGMAADYFGQVKPLRANLAMLVEMAKQTTAFLISCHLSTAILVCTSQRPKVVVSLVVSSLLCLREAQGSKPAIDLFLFLRFHYSC